MKAKIHMIQAGVISASLNKTMEINSFWNSLKSISYPIIEKNTESKCINQLLKTINIYFHKNGEG